MAKTTNYVPGVCNINPAEVKRRRMSGHLGLAVTLLIIVLIFVFDVTWYLRIVVIVPAFVAALGYLQARNKFCVAYASLNQQHADNGDIVSITDKDARQADATKSRKINLQATMIAALVTAVVCVIPA